MILKGSFAPKQVPRYPLKEQPCRYQINISVSGCMSTNWRSRRDPIALTLAMLTEIGNRQALYARIVQRPFKTQ